VSYDLAEKGKHEGQKRKLDNEEDELQNKRSMKIAKT
jgi:hypothetical protein